MRRSFEFAHALDGDRRVPAPSMRPPCSMSISRQIDDFRLARGILKQRFALGERGRHHQVFCSGDALSS